MTARCPGRRMSQKGLSLLRHCVWVVAVGCAPEEALCAELAAELRGCDLQAAELVCDALSYGEKEGVLAEVDAAGCGAWRDADGGVREEACAVFGWECPPAIAVASGAVPRSPVLYASGIDGTPAFDWNGALLEGLRARGADVVHVALPAWASAPERATALGAAVAREASESATGQVHLVCWAVSGIDCRYLVSPGGLLADEPEARAQMASAVSSITTIATPHQGTYVATAALIAADAPGVDGELTALLGLDVDEAQRFVEPALAFDLEGVRAQLRRLEPGEMRRFNERVPDAPGVHYQSFAGVSWALGQPYAPDPAIVERDCEGAFEPLVSLDLPRRDILSEGLLASAAHASRHPADDAETRAAAADGMVAVPSARWGVFRGCLPADHWDVVGQIGDLGPDPSTGFDARAFHAGLLTDLARREGS